MSKALDIADYGQYPPVRKNLLINGNFDVWQRGASFAAITNDDYSSDRWKWGFSGSMVTTHAKISNDGVPEGQANAYQVDVTTADASIAASDFGILMQFIEGYNTIVAGWHLADQSKKKSLTISFYSAHTKTGTHCVSIRNIPVTRSYVAEYTQSVSNAWEKHTITIPPPTDGTWSTDNSTGILLSFCAVAGTTFQTTADTWGSANYLATANQVNNFDSASNFFRLSAAQLEVGTEATDFEYRHFSDELALCQRYYEKSFLYTTAPVEGASGGGGGIGIAATVANLYCNEINFKVTKRTNSPTMTFYRGVNGTTAGRWAAWFNGVWSTGTTATTTQVIGNQGFTARLDGMTLTLGDVNLVQGHWTADVEL